jgi:CxxC-x17-CxxC domain-containing protein
MFQVTCDDCGTITEVPFEPRAGRPVYCRSCYERRRGTG